MIDFTEKQQMAIITQFEYKIERKRWFDRGVSDRAPLEYFATAGATYTESWADINEVRAADFTHEIMLGSFKLKREAVAAIEKHKNEIDKLRGGV